MPDFENPNVEVLQEDVTPIFQRFYRPTDKVGLTMVPDYGVSYEEWERWQDRGNVVNPDFAILDHDNQQGPGIPPEHLPEGVISLSDWRNDNPDWNY